MIQKREFQCLRLLREEHKDEHNLIRLWIVKWNFAKEPVLEKRRIWIDKHGVENTKRLTGFTQDDLLFIIEHQEEISKTLNGGQE